MNQLLVLLPSLLSRYSTQTLVIAIPWLLQRNGSDLADISWALLPFYIGTLVVGLVAAHWTPRGHLSALLAATLGLQALFSILCFFVEGVSSIAALRLLQGAATGLSRPLSQIWALEHAHSRTTTVKDKVLVTTWVQVAIAVGMALGSYAGAQIGRRDAAAIGLIAVFALPTLAVILVVTLSSRHANTPRPVVPDEDQLAGANPGKLPVEQPSWGKWLRSSGLLGIYATFFVSMAFYNIWPILFPFAYRLTSERADAVLPWLLVVQPVMFAIGQLITSRFVGRHSKALARWKIALFGLNAASVALMIVALATHSDVSRALTFLLAAGLAASTIYPLCTGLAMEQLTTLAGDRQTAFQRKFVVTFGVTGDMGQVFGGLILLVCGGAQGAATALFSLLVLAALLPLVETCWNRLRQPHAG